MQRLVGIGQALTRFDVSRARGLTSFEELSEQAGSRRREGLLLDPRDQLRDALQLHKGIGGTGQASRIRRETNG